MAGYNQLPFSEQVNFFKNKLNLPTDSYADLEGKDHDYAFVIAGANRNDMLIDFRNAVDSAIANGTTLEAFRKDFDKIVAKYGWDYNGGRNWRSRIIYDTNLYSSYSAGRYQQHQNMKKYRPYLEYRHRDGQKNPRPLHQSWDGIVLHADDPWWQTHYPINAYKCHCTVIAHSATSLKREGLTVSESPQINYVDKIIGKRSGNPRQVTLPEGIDYGFDRVPTINRDDMPSRLLLDKAVSVPPELASNMLANALKVPEVMKLLNHEVKTLVDETYQNQIAKGVSKSVGVLSPNVITAMLEKGVAPATAIITLQDTTMLTSISKVGAMIKSVWQNIADYLMKPLAVLLDKQANTLLYVIDLGRQGKVMISVDSNNVIKSVGKYVSDKDLIVLSGSLT